MIFCGPCRRIWRQLLLLGFAGLDLGWFYMAAAVDLLELAGLLLAGVQELKEK